MTKSKTPFPEVTTADIEGDGCEHKNKDGTSALKRTGIAFGGDEPDEELFRCQLCDAQVRVEKR